MALPAPRRDLSELGTREGVELDDVLDQDVPAAVVCARCGSAECSGCGEEAGLSGILSIVPWERGGPTLRRLWATARATTREPEHFFETLPDGPVTPALRFAVASELCAAGAMAAIFVPVIAAVAPRWLWSTVVSGAALRALFVGVPGLALLLVAAHAAHGYALDVGARRSGGPRAPSRALRFGLYATGWDLVLGPIGVVVVGVSEGGEAGLALAGQGVGLPGRSVRAFLRGAYGLTGDRAVRAARASYVAAVVATLVATFVIFAAVVYAMLA